MDKKSLIANIGVPVAVLLVVVLIAGGAGLRDNIETYKENRLVEEKYQQGITYIEQGKWAKATTALVFLQEDDYSYSKVLYNYAAAKEAVLAGEDYDAVSMADYRMRSVPDYYYGPFKDDILSFKKEYALKAAQQFKEESIKRAEQEKTQKEAKLAAGHVWIGMSKEEAEISRGKPYDINRTVGSWGVHEQWCYHGNIYLYFENGYLTSWQD